MTSVKPMVFLSHSTKDKKFVDKLANDLMRYGIECWYSDWELFPGDSLRKKIFAEGIPGSTCLVVVISPNSIESDWVEKELDAALIEELGSNNAKLVPVIWSEGGNDAESLIESLSSDVRSVYVGDLTDYEKGIKRLVGAIYQNKVSQMAAETERMFKGLEDGLKLEKAELQIQVKELENRVLMLGMGSKAKLAFGWDVDGEIAEERIVKVDTLLEYDWLQSTHNVDGAFDERDMDLFLFQYNFGAWFTPMIYNEGDVIANNIVVDLRFSDALAVYDSKPEIPRRFSNAVVGARDPRLEVLEFRGNKFQARYKLGNLVQTVKERLPDLYVCFAGKGDDEKLVSADVEYTVVCENGQSETGCLRVGLDVRRAAAVKLSYDQLDMRTQI